MVNSPKIIEKSDPKTLSGEPSEVFGPKINDAWWFDGGALWCISGMISW